MIELKNLKKEYKNGRNSFLALNDINLTINEKGLIIILGKSGSGKSTLLNILGGLDTHTAGELIVDEKNLNDFNSKEYDNYRNNYIGFIFQEFNLINEITVNENVEIPLKLKAETNRSSKIDEILSLVGMSNIGHKKCNELSGGQRQRVAIARALVKNPKIILADEPTGALDSNTSREIFELLKKVSHEKLVIVVTHNEDLAYAYADRIIKISDGAVIEDVAKVKKCSFKKISNNVLEVESDYELTKKDLKEIVENDSYIGISTNIHDLTLAYDDILDYSQTDKDQFEKSQKIINEGNTVFNNDKRSLPYKDAYLMAKDNLKTYKKKYNFLTSIFSVFNIVLIISFVFAFLNINSFIARQTSSANSLSIIEVSHLVNKVKENETQNITSVVESDNYGYVNKYNLTPLYGNDVEELQFVSEKFTGIIEVSSLDKLGLELESGTDVFTNDYEILISDYMAYNFSKYGVLVTDKENLELLYPSSNQELIDKEIRLEETNKNYKIIGIYKTNFSNLFARYNRGEYAVSLIIDSNIEFLYSKLIANIGFYKQYKEDYRSYSFYEEDEVFVVKLNGSNDTKSFYFSDTRLLLNKDKIDKGVKLYNLEGQEIDVPDTLNDNEMILSADNVLSLFNEENVSLNEFLKKSEVYNYLKNNELTLDLLQNNKHSSTDKEDIEIVKGLKIKIVGILNQQNRVFVSNNIYDSLKNHLEGYDSIYIFNKANSYLLANQIKSLSNEDNRYVVGNNLFNIEDIESLNGIIVTMSSVFIGVTIVFLILSFLICLNHMNILVKNRYKELILYRTIGAKKSDIYKMFLFESLHVSVKTSVVGVVCSYLLVHILNGVLSSITLLNVGGVKILDFNILYCLLSFVSVFCICMLASYLSVKGLLKKKLIEAFKNN